MRQLNPRDLEKRITDLEKNGGGGGGSVKWSDVTYKPFKTLDNDDFEVNDGKLSIKGGSPTPTGDGNKMVINGISNRFYQAVNGNTAKLLSIWNGKLMCAYNISFENNTGSELTSAEYTELSTEYEGKAYTSVSSTVGDTTTSEVTYSNKVFTLKWGDRESGHTTFNIKIGLNVENTHFIDITSDTNEVVNLLIMD